MPRKTINQEITNALLGQQLSDLSKAVDNGFKGIHDRQDTANGKLLQTGKDIIELQKTDIHLDNKFKYNKVIWYMLTATISLIIALVSFILFKP